jgi:hypothetical protein
MKKSEFKIKFNILQLQAVLEACEFVYNKMRGHEDTWRCKNWPKNKIDALNKAILKLKGHESNNFKN